MSLSFDGLTILETNHPPVKEGQKVDKYYTKIINIIAAVINT